MTQENPERTDAARAILDAIDFHDDGGDDPARIGSVVDDAILADVFGPSAVFEAFATMFRNGRVYETEPGHVRRTEGAKADRDTGGSTDEDGPSTPSLTGGDE